MIKVTNIKKNDSLSKEIIKKFGFSYGETVVVDIIDNKIISCELFDRDTFIKQSEERFLNDIKKDGFNSVEEWNIYLKQIIKEARAEISKNHL